MMSEQANGGPAFPSVAEGGSDSGLHAEFNYGMTLRDWFAGQALPAVITAVSAGQHHPRDGVGIRQSMAMDAYELADEMLKAREMNNVVSERAKSAA